MQFSAGTSNGNLMPYPLVIWLFPFAIGALMVHFAHHEYIYFYDALFGCIAAVIILITDKHFSITL